MIDVDQWPASIDNLHRLPAWLPPSSAATATAASAEENQQRTSFSDHVVNAYWVWESIPSGQSVKSERGSDIYAELFRIGCKM